MTSPFDGLRPPRPAPQLRARVLAAAEAEAERRHWIDAVWENRGLRMAFAFALLAALALNWNLKRTGTPAAPPRASEATVIEGIRILSARLEPPRVQLPEEIR